MLVWDEQMQLLQIGSCKQTLHQRNVTLVYKNEKKSLPDYSGVKEHTNKHKK